MNNEINLIDIEFIGSSKESGKAYGYPQCCIDEFCSQPPSFFDKMREEKKGPSAKDIVRIAAAHINSNRGDKPFFTGFVPCFMHAEQIVNKQIKIKDLILETRTVPLPFPRDWSLK